MSLIFRPTLRVFDPARSAAPIPAPAAKVYHGCDDPGLYVQAFYTAADWAAIPVGMRPANATYLARFDAWQVFELGMVWEGEGAG